MQMHENLTVLSFHIISEIMESDLCVLRAQKAFAGGGQGGSQGFTHEGAQ